MNTTSTPIAVGIAVGTTAITAAPVDLRAGHCTSDRVRLQPPDPPTPETVADLVGTVPGLLGASGPVGVALPAAVRGGPACLDTGVVERTSGLDPHWIGVDALELFSQRTEHAVTVVNDTDAAGIAEIHYGAHSTLPGVLIVLRLDTAIATAVFVDGLLLPNADLRSLAPYRAAGWTGEEIQDDLSSSHYAEDLRTVLDRLERRLRPTLIILSGAGSARADAFLPHLAPRPEVIAGRFQRAGSIVGAALLGSAARIPAPATPDRPLQTS